MKLVIAEKPSLGRAIQDWLQRMAKTDPMWNNYRVTWVFGHMYELYESEEYNPEWSSWDIKNLPIIPGKFKLKIKNDDGAKKQVAGIKLLLASAIQIINAGDPDREGQLLIDELLDELGNTKPVQRLWLAAIDDKSIATAFATIKPNSEFIGYKLAAQTRQHADWLIGMNYSRAMSGVFQVAGYSTISIGRVQTPTLKMIVDRDKAIINFKPRNFYELTAIFDGSILARLILPDAIKQLLDEDGYLLDQAPLESVTNTIRNKPGVIQSYKQTPKSTRQPLLFNLAELQALANRRFGYSATETLEAAQLLYENKLTSYPRSDCQYMPVSQHGDAAAILTELLKQSLYAPYTPVADVKSVVWDDKKVTAHHAIVPTGSNLAALSSLNKREQDIFQLIAMQYIAQFYPEYKYNETEIIIDIDSYQFKAIGKTIIDNGWKRLFSKVDDEDEPEEDTVILPVLQQGQSVNCTHTDIVAKQTQKPKHYTEGTLIKAMINIHMLIPELVKGETSDSKLMVSLIEQYRKALKETAGLGTEATRASIIETLKERRFISVDKKAIKATELGHILIDSLTSPNTRPELGWLTNPITTAQYEQYLDSIQSGSGNPETFLQNLHGKLSKLTNFGNLIFNIKPNENAPQCPKCNARNLRKLKGEYGAYWKCFNCNSNYKDNKNQPVLVDTPKPQPKTTGEKCPDCGSDTIERDGKFGKWKSCSNYPKCKWTPPKAEKPKAEPTGKKCDKCGSEMIKRKSKDETSEFLACSGYPKCKNIQPL